MKSLKKFLVGLFIALTVAIPASAQFRFGIKGGATVNDLKFNSSILSNENLCGFTGGAMIELNIPVVNLGVDASLLYARRSIEFHDKSLTRTDHRDYINIPINVKWKIGLPVIGKIISPFVSTGPDFSVLCSKQDIDQAWKNRKFDMCWNVGAGVELFEKVQVAANYGFGLTDTATGSDIIDGITSGIKLKSKDRVWTITLAYLF